MREYKKMCLRLWGQKLMLPLIGLLTFALFTALVWIIYKLNIGIGAVQLSVIIPTLVVVWFIVVHRIKYRYLGQISIENTYYMWAIKALCKEEKRILDGEWSCHFREKLNWIGVKDRYLLIGKFNKGMIYYLIPFWHIKKIELKSNGNIKIKYQNVQRIIRFAYPHNEDIVELPGYNYEQAREIVDTVNRLLDKKLHTQAFHLDSKLFDDYGSYGSVQQVAQDMPEDRRELMKILLADRYDRQLLLDKELNDYLAKMSSMGCQYVYCTNAIMWYFENREEEFQKCFGYPMKSQDGDFNFELLYVDLFSYMHGVNAKTGERDMLKDYLEEKDGPLDKYNFWTDTTGNAPGIAEREANIRRFAKNHGLRVEQRRYVDINYYNAKSYMDRGYSIEVSLHGGTVYTEGDNTYCPAHSMMLTGVDSNGWFTVASWGEEYKFDPRKNDYLTFGIMKFSKQDEGTVL